MMGVTVPSNPASRTVTRAVAAWVAVIAALAAGTATALLAVEPAPQQVVSTGFLLVTLWLGLAFTAVGGLLVALRPGNLLGPVLTVAGSALVVEHALRSYALLGEAAGDRASADRAAWAGYCLDPLFFPGSLILVLLLFPDGRSGNRWVRGLGALTVLLTLAQVVLVGLRPGPVVDESYGVTAGWGGLLPIGAREPLDSAIGAITMLQVWLLAGCALLLIVGWRRADLARRQAFKPLALAVSLVMLAIVLQVGGGLADSRATATAGIILLVGAVTVGLPGALAVAALRYRLWDLDRVIVSAIVFAGLAGLIAAVYVLVVLLVTNLVPAEGTSLLATVLVAASFAPARQRLTRLARRLVYGIRATPYEALVALPHQLAETPAPEDVLADTARILATGLGVPAARVRADLEGGDHQEAWSGPPGDGTGLTAVPVKHLGLLVGEVAVRPSPDRPLTSSDQRLLKDLAAQAGPAIRGVALDVQLRARLEQIRQQAADLRASRERLGAAQLAERRRLERDLHDGAQQHLVQLAIRLGEASRAADDGGPGTALRDLLERCHEQAERCLAELRELSRGHLPAGARRPRAGGGAEVPGSRVRHPDRGGGRRPRQVRPRDRADRLLLLPGGAGQHRQARRSGRDGVGTAERRPGPAPVRDHRRWNRFRCHRNSGRRRAGGAGRPGDPELGCAGHAHRRRGGCHG